MIFFIKNYRPISPSNLGFIQIITSLIRIIIMTDTTSIY